MKKLCLTFAAVLLLNGEASAHTHLVDSIPKDGAILAAGSKEIVLTFDGLLEAVTCVLTDAAGKVAAGVGAATLHREKAHLAITAPLAAGAYALNCRYKGADGHELSHALRFTAAG